jgi:hypothetical protein
VTPLSSFYRHAPQAGGIVIGLGTIPDRNVDTMVRRLGEIVGRARLDAQPLDLAS